METESRIGQWFSEVEAVGLFASKSIERFGLIPFVVLDHDVVCLFVVGSGPCSATITNPSSLEWRPPGKNQEPSKPDSWFPRSAREVWSDDRKRRLRTHQIFARRPEDDLFAYLGPAYLSSFGGMPGEVSASFSLTNRIPRDLWILFSGFRGWVIGANGKQVELQPGNISAFDRLLESMRKRKRAHMTITRYEEDCLEVHLNFERGWIMYLRHPGDAGLYVAPNPELGEHEVVFKCPCCGIDLEYPRSETLAREDALQIARDYFIAGNIPDSAEWVAG